MARKSTASAKKRAPAAKKKPAPAKKAAAKRAPAKKVVAKKAAAKKPVTKKAAPAPKAATAPVYGPKAAEKLKFYRHPTSGVHYAAFDEKRVHIKRGDLWGEFDRYGTHLDGPMKSADPAYCRWVTGEHIYNARLLAAKNNIWPLTRLAREGRSGN